MKIYMKKIILITAILFFSLPFILPFSSFAQGESKGEKTCLVYFTGLGCPHCAVTDPLVLRELFKEYPDLIIIEYEIYQQKENAPLLYEYNKKYNSGLGIPLIIFNQKEHLIGEKSILENIRKKIKILEGNKCPLIDGRTIEFSKLMINSLAGSPKIWTSEGSFSKEEAASQLFPIAFNFLKIISLAIVDAINPCALAVLSLILIAILTYQPTKRKNVLLAGLAFVLAIFILYLLYGLVIIKAFQLIQTLTFAKLWFYKILGIGALILGGFKLRDFFRPKTVCTISPKVDKVISKITGPRGAFLAGVFVTIFLLPCTIGPYIICGGILCPLGMLKAFPWLLLYNLIFILPMVAVVLIIYLSLSRIEDISSWQARNIKYLHLISGLIILVLGIAIVLGI